MYEILYNKAKETGCDVVDCDYYISDGKNNIEKIRKIPNQTGIIDTTLRKRLIMNPESIWKKIYRRELFTSNNIKFPENIFYEDNPVASLVFLYAKHLERVSKPLYFYYKNMESTSKKRGSYHSFDRLQTSEILIHESKLRGFYETYKEELDFRFIELYYLNTIKVCLLKFDKPEISYLMKIRNYMHTNMKDYRKNRYFKYVHLESKLASKLNDIQPKLLALFFSIVSSIAVPIVSRIRKVNVPLKQ